MTDHYTQKLKSFQKRHGFFIGVDSDGCAFDTMEVKHKQCFIPNIIEHFGLDDVAESARESAEFVNLYSKWRGINRFPALIMTLDLLAERDEVCRRNVEIPRLPALRAWLKHEPKPAEPALEAAVDAAVGGDADELRRVLSWSRAVNETIANTVRGVGPFSFVRESLEHAAAQADVMVVSATPCEALEREWAEHDLADYVALIAGQEMGTKAEHLAVAAGDGYTRDHVLMIGDAPGDLAAARKNGVLFYPINPGAEAESWERFDGEGMDRFLADRYRGEYETELIEAFEALLPDTPPWRQQAR